MAIFSSTARRAAARVADSCHLIKRKGAWRARTAEIWKYRGMMSGRQGEKDENKYGEIKAVRPKAWSMEHRGRKGVKAGEEWRQRRDGGRGGMEVGEE